ncbi:MAG: Clp protease ClpP [Bacteroides sp.]|nr:Clp protease ClpP [Bacteroides sp.]
MPKTDYQLTLTGYVGGQNFNLEQVNRVLDKHKAKPIDILIDSTGGSFAQGLSISAAFARHGQVSVHLVSLAASAATIASLGAKRVTIDAGAMYLVHKTSRPIQIFDSLNADQIQDITRSLEAAKEELDALDALAARLYARRCKRPENKLLDLMAKGGWITPADALEWGFVDEVTDRPQDISSRVSADVSQSLRAAIPTTPDPDTPPEPEPADEPHPDPGLDAEPGQDSQPEPSFLSRLRSALESVFRPNIPDRSEPTDGPDQKTENSTPTPADESLIAELRDQISRLEAENATLRNQPADKTTRVISCGFDPGTDSIPTVWSRARNMLDNI